MNINASSLDMNVLFSSLNSTNSSSGSSSIFSATGVGSTNWLSDYMSIKNGSYLKLMKAYYAKTDSTSTTNTSSTSISSDSSKALAIIEDNAEKLSDSADSLLVTTSKSLFNKVSTTDEKGVTTEEYDMDTLYNAVNSFVTNYNSVIESSDDISSETVLQQTLSLTTLTDANSNMLNKIGITVNSDNTLSIDEETFKESNVTSVKSLFNEKGAYGYSVSVKASMINYYASSEASKSNTYTSSGTYSYNYSSGDILNSFI